MNKMANTRKLVSFAKTGKKPSEAKKSVDEKPLTPAEERDAKAKQKVEELLSDVILEPKKEDAFELENDENNDNVEWLSEQVATLTSSNEQLRSELEIAKEDYRKIFDENQKLRSNVSIPHVSNDGVLVLFNELQGNYLKYPQQTRNSTTVFVRYILDRMLAIFPETKKIRKF
mgnify:CR=1 FL=1